MASIGWEGKRARILFRDAKGKQHTLRLGDCPKAAAETARVAVGHLVIAKRHGSVPHPDAVRWLGGIDDALYARVAALRLCQPREGGAVVTLGMLVDRFRAVLVVKRSTSAAYKQAEGSLIEHFKRERTLESITTSDADKWKKALLESGLATATVAKRINVAKAIFRKAVRWGMIPASPLADLKPGSQVNAARAFHVPAEWMPRILEECPDDQWRAVIALVRFAGLRCPSEVMLLRWGDINWGRGRLTVRSPKTEGHGEGHAARMVPIAPELKPILLSLFNSAEPGAEAVIPKLRDAGMNLRTTFEKIIQRAGLTPWPRLFQNLRASCATDWVERFPAHVVAGWLGHSPAVAARHYLTVRDAHFDQAAGIGEAAANPATHTPTSDTKRADSETRERENQPDLVYVGTGCDPVETRGMGATGLEPVTSRV